MPSIRAVSALMTSSNVVDCTTGRSAGIAPSGWLPHVIWSNNDHPTALNAGERAPSTTPQAAMPPSARSRG